MTDIPETIYLQVDGGTDGGLYDWIDRTHCEDKINDTDIEYGRQPKFDLINYIANQKQWALLTFGPGLRTEAVTAHIELELTEIRAKPTDIMEPIDVIILALDLLYRAGHTADEIVEALQAKQDLNLDREWPETVRGKPTEHIKGDSE